MSDLVTRAELIKLSRELGTDTERLSCVEPLGAADLRVLREQTSATLFDEHAQRFRRLAKLSQLAPPGLNAKLAQSLAGPVLSARIIALLPTWRAVELATKVPTSFLADICRHLDPRQVALIMPRIPTPVIVEVAQTLVERGDHVTMGRFVDLVTDDAVRGVVASVQDNEALVRVSYYTEKPEHLSHIVTLLDRERLQALVNTALTGSVELRVAALSLMSRITDDLKTLLLDLASEEPDAVLSGYLNTAVAENAVPELLTALTFLSPSAQARFGDLSAYEDPQLLDALVAAAAACGFWSAVLPIAAHMRDDRQRQVIQLVLKMDEDAQLQVARAAAEHELWPDLLRVSATQDAAAQVQLAAVWRRLGPAAQAAVKAHASRLDLREALRPALQALDEQALDEAGR